MAEGRVGDIRDQVSDNLIARVIVSLELTDGGVVALEVVDLLIAMAKRVVARRYLGQSEDGHRGSRRRWLTSVARRQDPVSLFSKQEWTAMCPSSRLNLKSKSSFIKLGV